MRFGPTPLAQARGGVAGVVLAAGRSSRMGEENKLLAPVEGEPMVRRVVETVLQAALHPVVVVLGHDADAVRGVLDDLPVRFVHNPEYASGIGSSVGAGVRAISAEADGVLIVLGDMPWISSSDLRSLVEAFSPEQGRGICAPVVEGKRGNPILWSARYFDRLQALEGDVGARPLLAEYGDDVYEVSVGGDGVLEDIDTPEALAAACTREGQA